MGFTIIELMIVLTIAGVLVSIAAPGFSALMLNSKLDSGVDKVTRALSFTRNLSLNNGVSERTVICPSDNPDAAAPTCRPTTETNYQTGWIVFIDCDGDEILDSATTPSDCNGDGTSSTDPDDVEEILRVQVELKDITISSTNTARIVFDQFGRAQNAVIFNIKKDGITFASITINALGRMNVAHNPSFY